MTEKKSAVSPVLPWKIKLSTTLPIAVMGFCRRSNGTVNRRLLNLLIPTIKAPNKIVEGLKISDITVDSSRNLWFRLFVPTDVSDNINLPVLVFFHGGGFYSLSPDTTHYDAMCRKYARDTPAVVVSVNYRHSPEHRYPAQYDDGFDVLKFIDMKSSEMFPRNTDISLCFLAGDAAGANIAHHVTRRVAEAESEFSELKVIGLILIQPFFGGEERTESEIRLKGAPIISVEGTDWYWKYFLPQGADRDHEAANVFGPKSIDISNLKRFPATLVFVGGFDPLQDWQKRYYEVLKKSSQEAHLIEYPNAFHGFYIFPELPEASLCLKEVINFIHRK